MFVAYGYRVLYANERESNANSQQQGTLTYEQYEPPKITPMQIPVVTTFIPPTPAPTRVPQISGMPLQSPAVSPQIQVTQSSPSQATAQSGTDIVSTSGKKTVGDDKLVNHPCGPVYFGAPSKAPCRCYNPEEKTLEISVECPEKKWGSSIPRASQFSEYEFGTPVSWKMAWVDTTVPDDLCENAQEYQLNEAIENPECTIICLDGSDVAPLVVPGF